MKFSDWLVIREGYVDSGFLTGHAKVSAGLAYKSPLEDLPKSKQSHKTDKLFGINKTDLYRKR